MEKQIARYAYAARKRASRAIQESNTYIAELMSKNFFLREKAEDNEKVIKENESLKKEILKLRKEIKYLEEKSQHTDLANLEILKLRKEIERSKQEADYQVNTLTKELSCNRKHTNKIIDELTKEIQHNLKKQDQLLTENQELKTKLVKEVFRVKAQPNPPISIELHQKRNHNLVLIEEIGIIQQFRHMTWEHINPINDLFDLSSPQLTIQSLEHYILKSTKYLSKIVACAKLFRIYEKQSTPTQHRFPNFDRKLCKAYEVREIDSIQQFEMMQLRKLNQHIKKTCDNTCIQMFYLAS